MVKYLARNHSKMRAAGDRTIIRAIAFAGEGRSVAANFGRRAAMSQIADRP